MFDFFFTYEIHLYQNSYVYHYTEFDFLYNLCDLKVNFRKTSPTLRIKIVKLYSSSIKL